MMSMIKNLKKQKILLIITKSNKGGAQKHVYDLATLLPKNFFEVVVALGGNGWLKEELKKESIKVISMNNLKRNINIFSDISVFFNLVKIFNKEKPDIIHLHSSKMGVLGTLAGRFYNMLYAKPYSINAKIIFTGHGWAFNEDRFFITKWLIALLHWLTIILAHKTIAVSSITAKQISKLPFTKNKIVVIHNGLENISFLDKNKARKSLLKEEHLNSTWIGTISELHKNKGLKYAIKSIAILKKENLNVIFIIIGEGEERQNLENLIKKEGLENNVFLIGHKDNAPTLLRAFDIFTLTSITEAFPYVLLEAGLAKLPTIASNTGGVIDIVDDRQSGLLVEPKQPKEIAYAIEKFIDNENMAKKFGENLHQKVTKTFTINTMINKIINIYNR